MTNEQIQKDEDDAMESAWRALKPELDPSNWTTGESFTYFGFFCWGWEARRQYDSDQIDALKAEVERLKELLKPFAAYAPHYPLKRTFGNRPATGEWHKVQSGGIPDAQIDVEDFHRAAAALKEEK